MTTDRTTKGLVKWLGNWLGWGLALALIMAGCSQQSIVDEGRQSESNYSAIVNNQPIPDFGGYSFERAVVIETYLARNRAINTYSYTLTETGILVEICASKGYPIPYATQLTSPDRRVTGLEAVVSNPEPNGLYSPDSAEASYIMCINADGSVAPTYWEARVFSLPYRIQADRILERDETVESSFNITVP